MLHLDLVWTPTLARGGAGLNLFLRMCAYNDGKFACIVKMQRSYGSASDTDIEDSRPLRDIGRNGATVQTRGFCSSLHRRFGLCSLQTVVACTISTCSCRKI